MGGCRCSFYHCTNNTTLAKESNSIHSHFFHFPVRDLKRCVEWAIYSNRMEFLTLTLDKLKNKVICDYHFSENHFMNYTRSKLNKTTAIPTIYINENKEEIDLLESPTEWVAKNRAAEVPAIFKDLPASKIDIDETVSEHSIQPVVKKVKIESPPKISSVINKKSPINQQKVRILNKETNAASNSLLVAPWLDNNRVKVTTYKKPKLETNSVSQSTVQQPTKIIVTRVPYQMKVDKTKSNEILTASTSTELPYIEQSEDNEKFEYMTVVQNDEDENAHKSPQAATKTPLKPSIPDEIKEFITQTSADISELKQIVTTSIEKSRNSSHLSSNITPSNLNKVQLFNGIKRYLSPPLMALLRLELFGGPNREYRRDEKIICGELLKLGDETYDFFNDEWRLRLPNKEQVRNWLNEESLMDDHDNDAS